MTKKQKKRLLRILAAGAMMIALHFAPVTGLPRFFLCLIPYLVIGADILRKAALGVLHGQLFDENFLMAVATLGALAVGLWRTGDYAEAVAVMLFYQAGELFQSCAVNKSRRAIRALTDIRPDYASIERDGRLERVDADTVPVGAVIVSQPGERVPIDGVVAEGESALNMSALTGESLPRDVRVGDEVLSGGINLTGVLRIRTTKPFGESTASRILALVENAGERKSRSEAFISRFARFYTPAVCAGAAVVAVLPPVIRMLSGLPAGFGEWVYRALTFLVISCPCALVISIPLTFFAAMGGASRVGVLVKGSNYLEALAHAETVAFDKTGTLTCGAFEVTGVYGSAVSPEKLIEYAALAESASAHPIGKSLQRAYGREIDRSRVRCMEETGGFGVTAEVDGVFVAAGSDRLMKKLNIACPEDGQAGTVVHVALGGEYAGRIVIEDVLRPRAAEAVAALKKAGVRRIVMLTGDGEASAEKTAREAGVDEWHAGLLPGQKVDRVEALLLKKRKGASVIFVGDGVNDAPVIRRCDVGVAMGAMGSDAAIEAADVVIMDDDPMKIPSAIALSRRCMRIVRQNIAFAIGVKALCLLLGVAGIADMWLAIFADVGVMVLAVLNAARALSLPR